jgi:hypothetical protein
VTALLTERRKSLETEQRRPAGGRVPELSPQLRALLDGRH